MLLFSNCDDVHQKQFTFSVSILDTDRLIITFEFKQEQQQQLK